MKKTFGYLFLVAVLFVVNILIDKTQAIDCSNNSSPPAQKKIAVEEMNFRPVFTTVVSFEKWQIPLAVTEELAIKKYDANFAVVTMLKTTALPIEQVVLSNKITTSMEQIAAATNLRDDRSHILKELMTSACMENLTGC